eukprot:2061002-Rhodomonas_salina.1
MLLPGAPQAARPGGLGSSYMVLCTHYAKSAIDVWYAATRCWMPTCCAISATKIGYAAPHLLGGARY